MPPKKEVAAPKVLLGRPKGNLRMGLVGLPNVGKSSTFNLLAKQSVPAENFPFCTINPHEARMNVPDNRFRWLCDHYKPKSEVSATLTVYDIAGLISGAHKGEGVGNAFLSYIQAVDGIYHVVRVFEDDEIVHTEGEVDPVKDMGTICDELRLKDLDRCSGRVEELTRQTARAQDKSKQAELEIMKEVQQHLESGKWISCPNKAWTNKEVEILNEYQFLTAKPVIYLLNLSKEDFLKGGFKGAAKVKKWIDENCPGPAITYSAAYEQELLDLSEEERASKSKIPKIIAEGYATLNLIHFFTAGEDEVRCWTIRAGTKAPQAAGSIHSDMEKGFISCDVTKYASLVEHGNDANVKAAGALLQKGKDYVVEDGDILFIKFNPPKAGKK